VQEPVESLAEKVTAPVGEFPVTVAVHVVVVFTATGLGEQSTVIAVGAKDAPMTMVKEVELGSLLESPL
jgi:hypothetical protein